MDPKKLMTPISLNGRFATALSSVATLALTAQCTPLTLTISASEEIDSILECRAGRQIFYGSDVIPHRNVQLNPRGANSSIPRRYLPLSF
jgi:hypothetical protein